mmetsp:Transcript_21212/g.60868  ORF Transcript_21212/g.60868 Transcript_21212/m.60868 type:complete len:216 (-) Transcript_21212:38-685(-)
MRMCGLGFAGAFNPRPLPFPNTTYLIALSSRFPTASCKYLGQTLTPGSSASSPIPSIANLIPRSSAIALDADIIGSRTSATKAISSSISPSDATLVGASLLVGGAAEGTDDRWILFASLAPASLLFFVAFFLPFVLFLFLDRFRADSSLRRSAAENTNAPGGSGGGGAGPSSGRPPASSSSNASTMESIGANRSTTLSLCTIMFSANASKRAVGD